MRYLVVLVFVAAAFGQMPESVPDRYEIGATAGYAWYGDGSITSPSTAPVTAGIRNRVAAGFDIGEESWNYVSGQISYLFQNGDPFLQGAGTQARIQGESHALTMELLFHFAKRNRPFRPFVAAGAGAKDYVISGAVPSPPPIPQVASLTAADQWKAAFVAGGGATVRLIPHMLLRLEFRDYMTAFPKQQIVPAAHSTAHGIFHQYTPLLGLSYTF